MTRANAITFTGGTNSLTLAPGSTITGRVVAFSAADTLALGGSGSASFDVSQIGASGQYQGFGAFQKTGASTWTLTGTNQAAMSWTVNAGTLSVNGSIASSNFTVNAGGTIGGNGTIGNTTINGGTLSPGNSIGTLTVQGNLVLTVRRRLHRRSLAHQCRPHQRHGYRDPRRHRAGGVRAGRLLHARLHHPLGNGRKHRHVQQPHHIRPACRHSRQA